MKMRIGVGLGALVLATVLTGCQKQIDASKLEEQIKTNMKTVDGKRAIPFASASCPSGKMAKAGDKFTCTAKTQEGEEVTIDVELIGDGTGATFKTEDKFMTQAAIGDSIEAKVHEHADVTCPETVVLVKVGKTFTCDVLVEGKKEKVAITIDAPDHFAWKLGG